MILYQDYEMILYQDYDRDFETVTAAIRDPGYSGPPYAYVRYGDGERHIMDGLPIRANRNDGWEVEEQRTGTAAFAKFAVQLRYTLELTEQAGLHRNYFVGLGCPCHAPHDHVRFRELYPGPLNQATFATLFLYGGYKRFAALDISHCATVGPVGCDYSVPLDALNPPWTGDEYADMLRRLGQEHRPILVSAGPLACRLVHDYWLRFGSRGRCPSIIDVGSALDPVKKGHFTRGCHDLSGGQAKQKCVWQVAWERV